MININTKVHHCEQGSSEWMALRETRITASQISSLMVNELGTKDNYLTVVETDKSGAFGKGALNYLDKKVDAMLGLLQPSKNITTDSMAHGTACEPRSRGDFEEANECSIVEVGMIEWKDYHVGVSPDGQWIEDEVYLEIKNYNTTKVNKIYDTKKLPKDAYLQVQMGLLTTGYKKGILLITDYHYDEEVKHIYTEYPIERDDALCKVMYDKIVMASEYMDSEYARRKSEALDWLIEDAEPVERVDASNTNSSLSWLLD